MPATRSRTDQWKRSLEQLHQRGGGLEISVPRPRAEGEPEHEERGGDLIWRCRILDMDAQEIVLEHPSVLGRPVALHAGTEIAAIIAIGQNRWMFRSRVLGPQLVGSGRGAVAGVRIAAPGDVERCQRRSFYRVSTVGLSLPRVECRALVDPRTVVSAETANEAEIRELEAGLIAGRIGPEAEEMMLPEVGPPFFGLLANAGGGGVGLMVEPIEAHALDAGPFFWLRFDLMPQIPAPLGVTARLVHTHIDSSQRSYAGMAFDFRFNPSHEKFVSDQICRYVAELQRETLRDRARRERAQGGA